MSTFSLTVIIELMKAQVNVTVMQRFVCTKMLSAAAIQWPETCPASYAPGRKHRQYDLKSASVHFEKNKYFIQKLSQYMASPFFINSNGSRLTRISFYRINFDH